MPFFSNLLHHPRKLLLRRALFQVHLWLGVLLSVYVALIGLSGSLLVFEDEFRAHATRDLHADAAHLAPAQDVLTSALAAYPGETATYLLWPSDHTPAYTIYLRTAHNGSRVLLADAATGVLLPARPSLFIDTVHDFHVYLLLGPTGFTINCLAGIALLLVTLSGAVLWWPGLRLWFRGFRISLRSSWKRITYDAHSLVGIATLLIVSLWSASCIDFLWPTQTARAVNAVLPLRGMQPPLAPKPAKGQVPNVSMRQEGLPTVQGADLASILEAALALSPHGHLSGVALPADPAGPVTVNIDTAAPGDYSHRDIYTFDAGTGQFQTTWHYGQNHTAGDWLLWLVNPLHFGTLWGLPIKILWSLLGLSLPILSATGLLLYWNRYLGKRWRRLTA